MNSIKLEIIKNNIEMQTVENNAVVERLANTIIVSVIPIETVQWGMISPWQSYEGVRPFEPNS